MIREKVTEINIGLKLYDEKPLQIYIIQNLLRLLKSETTIDIDIIRSTE